MNLTQLTERTCFKISSFQRTNFEKILFSQNYIDVITSQRQS
jgi:hypothetical protein